MFRVLGKKVRAARYQAYPCPARHPLDPRVNPMSDANTPDLDHSVAPTAPAPAEPSCIPPDNPMAAHRQTCRQRLCGSACPYSAICVAAILDSPAELQSLGLTRQPRRLPGRRKPKPSWHRYGAVGPRGPPLPPPVPPLPVLQSLSSRVMSASGHPKNVNR